MFWCCHIFKKTHSKSSVTVQILFPRSHYYGSCWSWILSVYILEFPFSSKSGTFKVVAWFQSFCFIPTFYTCSAYTAGIVVIHIKCKTWLSSLSLVSEVVLLPFLFYSERIPSWINLLSTAFWPFYWAVFDYIKLPINDYFHWHI